MDTNLLLSVSAGRHRLGYAIFRSGQLYYYGLRTLKRIRTKPELKNAVNKFLAMIAGRFEVRQIAMRGLNKQQRRNPFLTAITDQIETYCRQNDLLLARYEGRFINERFCNPNQRPTEERTTHALLIKYPHLEAYHGDKQSWRKQYYVHLFQALAVGLVHAEETENDEK